MVATGADCIAPWTAGKARPHSGGGTRVFHSARVCRGRYAGAPSESRARTAFEGFATELHDPRDGRSLRRYLHTSPEFAMKKLLVAGMPRIWQLAHVFRDGERSATHHPEFSMLEWYRAGASWRDLLPDCVGLLCACQAAAGGQALAWRGHTADAGRAWQEISVAEAFRTHCGIDILATAPNPLDPRFCVAGSGGPSDRRRAASGRRLGGALFPHLPRTDRTPSRHRRADGAVRFPGVDGGIVAAQPRRSPPRRALRALCLRS